MPPGERTAERGIGLGRVTPQLRETFLRLLNLLEEAASITILVPLVIREGRAGVATGSELSGAASLRVKPHTAANPFRVSSR